MKSTLNEFGIEFQPDGRHVIVRYSKSDIVLTVSNTERTIHLIYVNTAARQIANSGIATASSFETKLERAAKDTN